MSFRHSFRSSFKQSIPDEYFLSKTDRTIQVFALDSNFSQGERHLSLDDTTRW